MSGPLGFPPLRRYGLPLICALALMGAMPWNASAQEVASVPGFAFKGRMLVLVSDADMLASGYVDGRLGPPAGPDEGPRRPRP